LKAESPIDFDRPIHLIAHIDDGMIKTWLAKRHLDLKLRRLGDYQAAWRADGVG
jgi:hypothetical protein